MSASILAGPDVTVINVSRGGLLLESDVRLRPGLGICLNLTLEGRIHVLNGRVSHSTAALVEGRMVYRVGVALDEETGIFDSTLTGPPRPSEIRSVPDPPSDAPDPRHERDAEIDGSILREQLETEQREREQQARIIDTMREALQSGEKLRQEFLEAHAADRAQWEAEHQELMARVREAEDQSAAMIQDMRVARDTARRMMRRHEQEKADLEARVREREQQLAELRAGQAALLESMAQRLRDYEQRDDGLKQQQSRLSAQLAEAEAWGTDQQDLLYRLRQQFNVVFALLQGADPGAGRSNALPPPSPIQRLAPADSSLKQAIERTTHPLRALAPSSEKTGT